MNNTITEMKNTLEGINSRINEEKNTSVNGKQNGGNHYYRREKRKE